ncbi:glycoside hydrolase family 1 protein [Aspergillus ibericus CBS 121593]|uniref:Beta-glucosidase n=1 Tax=Aspergillus ibericus CBS 121593 TaxID=1448316 RepID=A0A395HDN9_9EURO|nr:beta-glucosidase [Aspergillus ibericus CBS 121593]RAL05962.1 beta-glucosidase [Aspergillus ibericus CBS 121593]
MRSLSCVVALGVAGVSQPAQASPVAQESPASRTSYSYGSFSYTQVTSTRYATALSSPLAFATPFAPAFSEASTLLPSNVTYTTYALLPSQTITPDGQYGQSAYAALWANLSYTSAPPFTTTVTPTPVPSSELVYPPTLYNRIDYADLKLPSDFIWGVAASAWQIEGGLQLEGRGPSALDTIGAIQSNDSSSDANIADLSYFLYKEDIARLAAIGVPYLSFSISWPRIVPFGVAGSPINTEGLQHYDDVINTCLEYGITPIVTLNHVDMPLSQLSDFSTLSENFLYYAKQVMTRYADRVPYWVTFNEPNIGVGTSFSSWNDLTHVLTAHAAVYHWYKEELQGTGQITVKFANNLAVPLDPSNSTHVDAALRYQDFILGIMGNPLFLGEQYPSEALNTPNLNLTALTPDQISTIHGTVDFWAFDPYVAQFASPAPAGISACAANQSDRAWPECVATTMIQADGWLMGDMSNAYAAIAPQYVRQQLGYIWDTFNPSGILVAEFGFNPFADSQRDSDAQRYDLERTLYYQDFLEEILKAIHEDGVNVIGTLAWSYLDNNEFGSYANQYGMQSVNRTDGSWSRRYKRSLFDYVDFFHEHSA